MQNEIEPAADDPETPTKEQLAEEIGRDLIEELGSLEAAYKALCLATVDYAGMAASVSRGFVRSRPVE